jgi:type IV pilus assembly protein PilM
MPASVIGLEIAEEAIRAVEVTHGKHPTMVAGGEVPLPPGVAKDSEVIDPDAVALAVRQLWAHAGLKSRKVVLGVANRRILVREYVSPKLPPALLKAALPFEVGDLLPVPVDQAVLDFYPISETDTQILGLLVAAVSETVEGLISTLGRAKVRATAVDFLPFGLARLGPAATGPAEQAVAIASIGEHTTSVVITVAGVPRFVRIIPVDLAGDSLPQPAPDGVARRVLDGGGPPLDPELVDLVARLRGTLDFYNARDGAVGVGTLYLTGAAATAPGVGQAIAAGLDVAVRYLGVPDLVALSKSAASRGVPPPSLVNALGIALGDAR